MFANNYFQNSRVFVNPFLEQKEMKEFLKIRKDISKVQERNYNLKHFTFSKLSTFDHLSQFIPHSLTNNRIPMILSSKQLLLTKEEFIEKYLIINPNPIYQFSLRDIQLELQNKGNCDDYLDQIKQQLSNVLVKGETLLINLDESQQHYDQIYDPDFTQFYSPSHFPSQIFYLSQLRLPQIYEKILAGTPNKSITKISTNFQIIVWSKFRIDQELDQKNILEKFERRFKSFLPVQKIDLVLMVKEQTDLKEQIPSIEKIGEEEQQKEVQKESPQHKKKN